MERIGLDASVMAVANFEMSTTDADKNELNAEMVYIRVIEGMRTRGRQAAAYAYPTQAFNDSIDQILSCFKQRHRIGMPLGDQYILGALAVNDKDGSYLGVVRLLIEFVSDYCYVCLPRAIIPTESVSARKSPPS
jgi:hypothetical protein